MIVMQDRFNFSTEMRIDKYRLDRINSIFNHLKNVIFTNAQIFNSFNKKYKIQIEGEICNLEKNQYFEFIDNEYKDKGFTVYGVSLDRTKDAWVKAIAQDGLNWTQVSDLKFWQSVAAKDYGVSSIPFALLLDAEGKVLGKNLRGSALQQKLAEVLK